MIRQSTAPTLIGLPTTALPSCPRGPSAKRQSQVEGAVLLAERWIMARLRNQRFFSLDELNAAIRPLLDQLNGKVTRHLGASRRDLFEQLDRPALKALPVESYVYAEWKQCRARAGLPRRHWPSLLLSALSVLKQTLWAGSPREPWRSILKGNAWPHTFARRAIASILPIATTCPHITGSTKN